MESVKYSMEKTVKTTKKSGSGADKWAAIIKAYMEYVLTEGHAPASVFLFTKENKWKEDVFYQHFASFKALEKVIWLSFFEETVEKLHQEELYQGYSSREKMLAFYYTFIEVLKQQRSYVIMVLGQWKKSELVPPFLKSLKTAYIQYAHDVLNEGMASEEVVDRPYITKRYADGLWVQLLFILKFWVDDESTAFERTDTAIEKAVNFAFDLMGKSLLDSAIDFAKFLYQSRQ